VDLGSEQHDGMIKLWGRKSPVETAAARQEEDPHDLALSTNLELSHVGPYEILAPIGKGGFGTVYKAIDRAKDLTVAIKVLSREYDLDRKRRKRDYLGREILIASSLRHECIIRYHKDIIEQEDIEGHVRRCLIMEFIDGNDLRYYIKERVLTIQQMINIWTRLCHGLDFLHQNHIVHRDVTPGNFLFSRDLSKVKICDFGLSKSSASWRTRFIREGGGTRPYMSPEQIANKGKGLDARSDIFSFGIVMYELLAGRHPCEGRDAKEIMRQLRSKKYRFQPPSKYNPSVPSPIDRIVLKALRRNADRRYQSITEMLLDLTRYTESRI
jgi:eukaryotic-like serine/threonine-protein kinase